MTATKTFKPAKDGTSASFTHGMATESVGGNLTLFVYIAEPSGETLISPMPASGGSVGISGTLPAFAAIPTVNLGGVTTPVVAIKSAALETSHVFKASQGVLLDAYCLATTAAGFFMLFDAVSAPLDGAVTPLATLPVGVGQSSSFDFPAFFPLSFVTGLVGVFSTTGPFTKTASATAFMSARVI